MMTNGERKKTESEDQKKKDTRTCILCTVKGDQLSTVRSQTTPTFNKSTHFQEAGRLLPCGSMDEWVHVNCALWSAEVYEEDSGLLYCVHSAIARGQRLVSQ